MEKPTPALIETPLQGRASASQTGATGQASLLPISQTRCGDLDNLLREPSNFDNPEIRILIAQAFEVSPTAQKNPSWHTANLGIL